jgi:hypothetical protein
MTLVMALAGAGWNCAGCSAFDIAIMLENSGISQGGL